MIFIGLSLRLVLIRANIINNRQYWFSSIPFNCERRTRKLGITDCGIFMQIRVSINAIKNRAWEWQSIYFCKLKSLIIGCFSYHKIKRVPSGQCLFQKKEEFFHVKEPSMLNISKYTYHRQVARPSMPSLEKREGREPLLRRNSYSNWKNNLDRTSTLADRRDSKWPLR